MAHEILHRLGFALLLFVLIKCTPNDQGNKSLGNLHAAQSTSDYSDLINFFQEWREFQHPEMIDGIPDYSKPAMDQQYAELANWKDKLNAFDTAGWTIANQVDWYLIWAEMNGLEFDHRVKRPWERDPAFYTWFFSYPSDVPEREGPNIHGTIELPNYRQPLSPQDAAEITQRMLKAPIVFEQAKVNLTGNAKDLWVTGARSIREQSEDMTSFAQKIEGINPELAKASRTAALASDEFAEWLESKSPQKTGTSGVGKENYSWNLQKVHLLPYSWEEQELIIKRELVRSHTALRLEENRNRHLPRLTKIDNATDYDRLFNAAVTEYQEFLKEEEILPIRDYMEAAFRARVGKFTPLEGLRGFFSEISYRDPIVMRTHDYHWIDLARMREEPHVSLIRNTPLLYNIFDGRAEGVATGMEEMMMHAGLFKDRPRSKELIWILLAQRAARALGGLYQHGLEMDLQQATEFASKWTPWELLPADGSTIQHEEQFYLQQPAYGTSYVIGKIEIEKLIAEYARQRAGNFSLYKFMDDLNGCGVIPVSLIYWELTGDKSMLEKAVNY